MIMGSTVVINQTSLYRHFSEEGDLLYIGISLSALTRLGQHADAAHWYDSISDVKIEHFDTREKAIIAEREAIKTEKPEHNIHHKITTAEINHHHDTAFAIENAKVKLVNNIVNLKIMYSSPELSREMSTNHKYIKQLCDENKLTYAGYTGSVYQNKSGHLVDGRKFYITGWAVIDYLESLESGTLEAHKPWNK